MDKVRVYYDAFAKTLTVWLTDPETEEVCEEADDETVLMKIGTATSSVSKNSTSICCLAFQG